MENVIVNGRIETIGSDRHIVDIIRQCCGDDFFGAKHHIRID